MMNRLAGYFRGIFVYSHAGRSLSVDMLRGVAILLVLFRHNVMEPVNLGFIQGPAAVMVRIGWAGVDLFFVLSGFLVSGLLFAELRKRETVDVKRFIIRRGFKIWPPYFVFLAFLAVWIASRSHWDFGEVLHQLWPNLLHVQNYFYSPRVHTWSLAVEEHFYLAVALGVYGVVCLRRPLQFLHQLPLVATVMIVGLMVVRYLAYQSKGPELNLYATHLRFDGLLIGTLLAYMTHFKPQWLSPVSRHPLMLVIVGLAMAAPTLYLGPEANRLTVSIGLAVVYVGFALAILGFMNLENSGAFWKKSFTLAPAVWLGQIGFYSYSIYLWHVDLAKTPIKKVLEHFSGSGIPPALLWVGSMCAYIIVASLAGFVLSLLLEKPSLAMRNRLFPAYSTALPKNLVTGK